MLIDWFTVGAQVVNFLVLAWLLKRFLYKPILDAIDAREKRIAAELALADAKMVEAQKERDDFHRKNEAFDQEHAALLKKATEEANTERQRLLDEARKDADALRAKRQEAFQSEQRNLNGDIVRRTQKHVFAIARKALADLAGASLEQRMSEEFVRRLRTLTGTDKTQMAGALNQSSGPARVRSAFGLSPEQQASIQDAVNETFSTKIPLQFETASELVSGIELAANGRKVAWSIAEYLAALEQSASERGVEPTIEPAASAPKANR